MTERPAVSVVLPADTFETIRMTVEHLRHQTVVDRLELVIATNAPDTLAVDDETCAPFHSVRIVETDSLVLLTEPRADATRAASAEIVLIAETHSFPEPDALEALLARHEEPWTVVAPTIRNGNPGSAISWANILMDYGSQMPGTPSGEVPRIASHNGSYKRAALLELGDDLGSLFGAGDVLNDALVTRGGSLYFEAKAVTAHFNVSRVDSWRRERLAAGRAFAGHRARAWPLTRRLVYACGWWLIPFVRLARIRPFVRRAGLSPSTRVRVYTAMLAGLVMQSFGELVGYVSGVGSGELEVSAMELHRRAHLRDDDLPAFDGA
jgi:hypothetical protein